MKNNNDTSREELREQLAAIEHERWADWQKWMHQCAFTDWDAEGKTIYCYTEEQISRWDKQIETPYSGLSEQEKQSDREQVDRYWQLILQDRERAVREARVEGIKEAYEKILEIVYAYTHPDEPNFCDVDDVSRISMSWKVDRIAQLSNPTQRVKGDPNKLPTQEGTVIQFELEGLTIDAIVDDDNTWGVSSRVNGYKWLTPEELLEACGGKYTVIAPLTPTQEKKSK